MIHLTNLSMAVSLLNDRAHSESAQAAREHVVATEPDPENVPVIGPRHHNPGSPSEGIADPLAPVALNPQPLPPIAALAGIADPLSAVALNPQPLPPKEALASIADRFSAVAINPQPLPPREALEDLNRLSLGGRFG